MPVEPVSESPILLFPGPLLFLTFSALLVANPKKTTLHGGQSRSARGLLNREKKKIVTAGNLYAGISLSWYLF